MGISVFAGVTLYCILLDILGGQDVGKHSRKAYNVMNSKTATPWPQIYPELNDAIISSAKYFFGCITLMAYVCHVLSHWCHTDLTQSNSKMHYKYQNDKVLFVCCALLYVSSQEA